MSQKTNTINVLLLGETGVGKSTFLNALQNYLTYDDLSDVTDVKHLIPTKFLMMDADFNETLISLGDSTNEVQEKGKSATVDPRSYSFDLKDGRKVVIVDTPGMGDTRGIENDKRNTERILAFVSEMDHLNAICVLFKSNTTRLTVLFTYCIKSILGQLDNKLRENILFIFTHGRSSFYTPGDTYEPLKKLLEDMNNDSREPILFKQSNTFCLENDVFRYLVARKNGMIFEKVDVESYDESWKRSSATSKRMIEYIQTLRPRSIKGMLTINEAKILIRKLAAPMLQILMLNQKANHDYDLYKQKFVKIKESLEYLNEKLHVPHLKLVKKRTIVNTEVITSNNKLGHAFGITPLYELKMNESKDTTESNTIKEELVLVEFEAEDAQVKTRIENAQDDSATLMQKINEVETLMDEYDDEVKKILRSTATFAVFLEENALTHAQDPMMASLRRLVAEEKRINDNQNYIDKLEQCLKAYNAEKIIVSNVSVNSVQKEVDILRKLKHSGHVLEDYLQA